MIANTSPLLGGRFRALFFVFIAVGIFLTATAPPWLMAYLVSFASGGRLQLEQPQGSFWSGRAASVSYTPPDGSRQQFQNFYWDILASRLLQGKIAATVMLTDSRVNLDGAIEISLPGTKRGDG